MSEEIQKRGRGRPRKNPEAAQAMKPPPKPKAKPKAEPKPEPQPELEIEPPKIETKVVLRRPALPVRTEEEWLAKMPKFTSHGEADKHVTKLGPQEREFIEELRRGLWLTFTHDGDWAKGPGEVMISVDLALMYLALDLRGLWRKRVQAQRHETPGQNHSGA